MENKKILFSVDNITPLNDDDIDKSQFSKLLVDCFATGRSHHDTFVTEENLKKMSKTILLKPFVFEIDGRFMDLGSHSEYELPGGFVPHNSRIDFRTLDDGRVMMSVEVLIWKRYSQDVIEYFKRDGGKKGVSVEIEVFEEREDESTGLIELVDFCFNAITGLGDVIRPAIPNAQAILQFSEEFDSVKLNFRKYEEIDFKIPDNIKENAKKGLESKKGTSVALAMARYLSSKEMITPERARLIFKYLNKNLESGDADIINLYGGKESFEWVASIVSEMEDEDEQEVKFFEYKSMKDANPAIKGIEPPVSVSQANKIARDADKIGTDKNKNGWAIAISNFKKTHEVKDNKWVKKESSKDMSTSESVEDLSMDNAVKEEKYLMNNTNKNSSDEKDLKQFEDSKEEEKDEKEMSQQDMGMKEMSDEEDKAKEEDNKEEMAKEEDKEENEKKEISDDEDKEDEEYSQVSMSLGKVMDVEKLLSFLGEQKIKYSALNVDDKYKEILFAIKSCVDEISKGLDADVSVVNSNIMKIMFASSDNFHVFEAEVKAQASELSELRAFKKNVETEKKNFEVETVLKEAFSAGMPKQVIEECRRDAENFSLEDIDAFKNKVRARAFSYIDTSSEAGSDEKIGFDYPFAEKTHKSPSLWN